MVGIDNWVMPMRCGPSEIGLLPVVLDKAYWHAFKEFIVNWLMEVFEKLGRPLRFASGCAGVGSAWWCGVAGGACVYCRECKI